MRPVAPHRVGPQAASPACVRRAGAALCAAALIQYGLIRQRRGRQADEEAQEETRGLYMCKSDVSIRKSCEPVRVCAGRRNPTHR